MYEDTFECRKCAKCGAAEYTDDRPQTTDGRWFCYTCWRSIADRMDLPPLRFPKTRAADPRTVTRALDGVSYTVRV